MKLPCAVTRDLLPLYVENMVEQETKVLVKEHLDECDACREKLSEMSVSSENPIDTARPLQNLKKQIQIKRLYAAALAAYYSMARDTDKVEVDYLQKKNVKKPAGAAPGFVVYYTNFSMVATPSKEHVTLVDG